MYTLPGIPSDLLSSDVVGTRRHKVEVNPLVSDAVVGLGANNIWPFGETLVGQKRDDISLQYQYDYLNTDFDFRTPVTTGDGAVTQAGSMLILSSTTGSAEVESIAATSYRPGHSGFIDFTALFIGTGSAVVGGKDAFQLRYNNGALTFGYVKGGVFVSVPVDTTGIKLEKLNIWRIAYGFLGSASPKLFIKQGAYRQAAIVETEGEIEGTHLDDPNFVAFYSVSGACTMKGGSFAAGVVDGAGDIGFRSFTFPTAPLVDGPGPDSGDVVLAGTTVKTLAVFRNKATYKGQSNSVRATLALWSNYVKSPASGAGDVVFQIVARPTLSGVPTYTDIDANSSVMEVDHTAGTGASVNYVSGGRVIMQAQIPYAAGIGNKPSMATFSAVEAAQLGANSAAGDVFAVIAKDKGGGGVTVRSTFGWRERF